MLGVYHSVCKRHFLVVRGIQSVPLIPHTIGYELKNEPRLNKKLSVFD